MNDSPQVNLDGIDYTSIAIAARDFRDSLVDYRESKYHEVEEVSFCRSSLVGALKSVGITLEKPLLFDWNDWRYLKVGEALELARSSVIRAEREIVRLPSVSVSVTLALQNICDACEILADVVDVGGLERSVEIFPFAPLPSESREILEGLWYATNQQQQQWETEYHPEDEEGEILSWKVLPALEDYLNVDDLKADTEMIGNHLRNAGDRTIHNMAWWRDRDREKIVRCKLLRKKILDELAQLSEKALSTVENNAKELPSESPGKRESRDATFRQNNARQKAKQLEALLGEDVKDVLMIANSKKTVDQKMREICGLDRRCLSWKSPQWAKVLGVSDPAIRKTPFWKEDREKAIEAN